MGSTPKTVGGGSNKNTAIGFNDFLMQGLTTGSFGNVQDPRIAQGQGMMGNQAQHAGGLFGNVGKQVANAGQQLQGQAYQTPGANSGAQSMGQTSLMGNAINSLLGSNPNGMIDSNQYLSQLGNINQNAPQFQQANMGQLGTNFDPGSLMGQFGNIFGSGQSTDLQGILGQLKGIGGAGAGGGAGGDFSYKPGQLLNYDINSPEFQAISQLSQRRKQEDVANLRGRFGLVGGSLGSGASRAEGQYLAEANPQETLALGQLGRQMQEMDLGQQQVNNNLRQGLLGQQVQAGLGNASLANQSQGNLLNALTSIYGQNLGYNMNRGNSLIGMGQQDISNQANAFGMNSQNQQVNNQNAFNSSQAQNQFNQNNFGQQSQNSLGVGNIGAQIQQLVQSGQLGALGQLFGSFNQSNQIGSPQAQTVMQPSGLSQGLGALTGIAGIAGGLMSGNPMAAVGGLNQMSGSLGGSTPFMNSNSGLFSGAGGNLGMGGRQGSVVNPQSVMQGLNLGMGGMPQPQGNFQNDPRWQAANSQGWTQGTPYAMPNMMNAQGSPQMNPLVQQLMGGGGGNPFGYGAGLRFPALGY